MSAASESAKLDEVLWIPEPAPSWARGGRAPSATISARTQRARRQARRQGLVLQKSRGRLHQNNLGGYGLINPRRNLIVAGERFDLSLADVQAWLEDID